MLGNRVAVTRSRQQRAQNQEIESAAKELDARRSASEPLCRKSTGVADAGAGLQMALERSVGSES